VKVPDLNRLNNVVAAADPLHIAFADLPLGADVTASFPVGDVTYYRLTIPAGSGPVHISAQFAADNAGALAARFAELPTGDGTELVGLAKVNGGARLATIDLPAGMAGVYYISVRRITSSPVILRAAVTPLALTGLQTKAT